MEDIAITLGNRPFLLVIAESGEDRYDGLSDYQYLDDDEGMLFIFDSPGRHPMVMRGMEFPIDIIHLNKEGVVSSVVTMTPEEGDEVYGDPDTQYVIEIAADQAVAAGVQPGYQIEIPVELDEYLAEQYAVGMARQGGTPTLNLSEKATQYNVTTTDIPEKEDKLQVLDHDGKVLSNIDLGARIFSRPHTKQLIEIAKAGTEDENLKKLGMLMVSMIYTQDTQQPEYTT